MLFRIHRVAISLALALLFGLAPLAHAQGDFSAADKAAFKAYALDAGKVNRFIGAISTLAMAMSSDDALAEDFAKMDNEPGDSVAEIRAKIARHPRIFAFFQRQMLSADDSVLLPLALTFAGIAAASPGAMADRVTPAQASFVKANGPLMERFSEANEALENATP
jgi:hypothetical protein